MGACAVIYFFTTEIQRTQREEYVGASHAGKVLTSLTMINRADQIRAKHKTISIEQVPIMTFLGVGLFYFNKISEASLTASGGILTTLVSVQHTKQKKEELCEMLDKLSE